MNARQKQDFLINVAYWAFVLLVVYLAFKYVFPITIPFILGFCVAYLVVKISRKIKLHQKILRILLIVLLYGTVGTLLVLLVLKGISSLNNYISMLPTVYESYLAPMFKNLYDKIIILTGQLEPEILSTVQGLANNILVAVRDLFKVLSEGLISFASGVVKGVPSLFISVLVMIISTFFFALDYEKMEEFVKTTLSEKWRNRLRSIKTYFTDTFLVVIRSYVCIMLLTFTELSLLFTILGFKYGVLIAGIIAVFDIMPILGSGGIIIPWAVISLISGNIVAGIKLFIIYGIITVVRNYVEPKIVGGQLGIHPVITLVSMFIGLRLFGFLGLFGLPVAISFFWKKMKDDNEKKQAEVVADEA